MNVDAAAGKHGDAGGALLRDDTRQLIRAISFSLPTLYLLHAEMQALLFSMIFFVTVGYIDLQIQIYCLSLLNLINGSALVTSRLGRNYDRVKQQLQLMRSRVGSTPQEANSAAHFLAQQCLLQPRTCIFSTFSDLPPLVRGSMSTEVHTTYF